MKICRKQIFTISTKCVDLILSFVKDFADSNQDGVKPYLMSELLYENIKTALVHLISSSTIRTHSTLERDDAPLLISNILQPLLLYDRR